MNRSFSSEINRPLNAWEYWGLRILYSIPVIGLVFLIVFSISDKNINRRNYTRSYWCTLLVLLIVVLILMVTGKLNDAYEILNYFRQP